MAASVIDLGRSIVRDTDVRYVATAGTTAVTDDCRYWVGNGNAAQTFQLPNAAARQGQAFHVKKAPNVTGALVVTSAGGTIDGAAAETISVGQGFRSFVSDGTDWLIFGGNVLPVIYQLSNVASGGTIAGASGIDASLASTYRVTCAANATLGPPQAATAVDGDIIELEILCTAAGTITTTITGTAPNIIFLTGAAGATVAIGAGKRAFFQLKFVSGVGWFLRGQSVQA